MNESGFKKLIKNKLKIILKSEKKYDKYNTTTTVISFWYYAHIKFVNSDEILKKSLEGIIGHFELRRKTIEISWKEIRRILRKKKCWREKWLGKKILFLY